MRLGTQTTIEPPRYSTLPSIHEKWVVTGRETQYGIQSGYFGVAAQFQKVQNHGPISLAARHPVSEKFSRRIDALYEGIVFIYDDESKTGWLCSMIDLIVLMLRVYLRNEGCRDRFVFPERWANLEHHKESKTLLKSRQVEYEPIEPESSDTYGSLIMEFSCNYVNAFSGLNSILRGHSRDKLIGFDLLDLVNVRVGGRYYPKELPVKGGICAWAPLVGNEDVVFCKGLRDVISPDEMNGIRICPFIRSPPLGKDILLCPVYLLRKLCDENSWEFRAESISNPRIFEWIFTVNPFQCPSQSCVHEDKCWRHRLQQANSIDTKKRGW